MNQMMAGMNQMLTGMVAGMNQMGMMGQSAVVLASYGGHDVTHQISQRLAQHGTISWGPGQYVANLGGDPFPNQYKDFVVVTIDHATTPPKFKVNVFEDNELCNVTLMHAPSTNRRVQPIANGIVLANYGGRDVTAQCQQMFNQRNGLYFDQAPHLIFGDPVPNVLKALVVIYTCNRAGLISRDAAFWFDGETIQMPRG
jgi:hypothetical protein